MICVVDGCFSLDYFQLFFPGSVVVTDNYLFQLLIFYKLE